MKILTEKEQLLKRKDELFEASNVLQCDINKLENKVRDFSGSIWKSKREKAKLMNYELKQMKNLRDYIRDYYSVISDRYDQIIKEEKAEQTIEIALKNDKQK